MKKSALIALMVLLVGCQATGKLWVATGDKDQFTDEVTEMVTVGEVPSDKILFTKSMKFYPFIGKRNGETYVGIRSGGRFRIPTGTVQIRIDNNKTWTISPEETPIYLIPAVPTIPAVGADANTESFKAVQAQAMESVTRLMSPYTAATGDKAKLIIKEMLGGKVVRYRTIGANQPASTTGEVMIDASFAESLRAIGITASSL